MKKNLDYYMRLEYEVSLLRVPEDEGSGFIVWHQELGRASCNGFGKTVKEALDMLTEVKQSIFEDCLEESLPIPEPAGNDQEYSGKLLLRIPKMMHRAIAEVAKENETSINSAIVQLLTEAMAKHNTMEDTKKALAD